MKRNASLIFVAISFLFFLSACNEASSLGVPTSIFSGKTYSELIAEQQKKLLATWSFPGSDIGPAEMQFWSNGLLVVNSEIFSNKKSERYFLWSLNDERSLMSISFSDERISFNDIVAPVEKTQIARRVHSIDERKKIVVYFVENQKSIFFLNWRFSGEPINSSR